MGLQRSGDCHIFLGKARVCDFKWAPEEKMAKKKGDVWILSDNGGFVDVFTTEKEATEYINENYDAGRGVNDEVDGIEVIHATTIQTYYTEVPVPIIKLVPGEKGG
jgi:hypothetical protein